jgi:hypothetical protein
MRSLRSVSSAVGSVLLALCLVGARPAQAQVSAYADFTASKLTNLVGTSVLYGPTIGLTATVVPLSHIKIGVDLRGSFLGASQRLDGIALGPSFAFSVKGLKPYAEILVGFARYNDGLGNPSSATTDGQLDFNGGVDKRITDHIDWRIFEFGYEQYYALGGQFNPKNFSTGIVYHFAQK